MSMHSTNLFFLALILLCFVTFTILFTPLFALVDGAKRALCFSAIWPVFPAFFWPIFFGLVSLECLGPGAQFFSRNESLGAVEILEFVSETLDCRSECPLLVCRRFLSDFVELVLDAVRLCHDLDNSDGL